MHRVASLVFVVSWMVGTGGPAWAQRPGTTTADSSAPAVVAARANGAVRIDGRLDDAAWSAATAATGFTQRNPREGEPASERTEVRILYDDVAVYIGARLHDASGKVSSRLGRRDSDLAGSDWFTVSLDSYHDHLTAYRFSVNPDGVRQDEKQASGDEDSSWDPVWQAEATRDAQGWTAELRIPLSQLRFRDEADQTWGIQLTRQIARNNEESWFAFVPKRERSGVARYGHLNGLQAVAPRGRLELLPYAVTRAQYRAVPPGEFTFANPFADGSEHTASLGLDLKYRLASNLTLDATINPDFGQVEVDPAVVNLTAFETRFDERRPFFIEGSDIFRFGGGGNAAQLFYSRRIGAPPVGQVPSESVFDDVPDHSTILGAAKLSGKIGGWSLGVLDALTARERADYITEDESRSSAQVSPLSNYFAGRALREMREGETVIGGILTSVHRDLTDPSLANRVRSSAYTGGIDFNHAWADRSWSLSGYAAGSHIAGNRAVITSAQRSSARYYHRPDADYLQVDSSAITLGGLAAQLQLRKEAGLHWRGRTDLNTVSPGYEINDFGFQSRADRSAASLNVEYVEEEPGRFFREWNLEAQSSAEWNYGGNRLGTTLGLEGNGEFLNYWNADFELRRHLGGIGDRLTRGGPLTLAPASSTFAISVESDSRKAWTLDVSVDHDRGLAAQSTSIDFSIGFKPAPNWNFSIGPEWARDRSHAQYVTSIADTLARATFGRRYVFADLVETELSLATHLNVTFTPALTLEVFARPFVGSGTFGQPKELVRPRSFAFNRYDQVGTVEEEDDELVIDPDGDGPAKSFAIDDEDFTFRSLRGNAVLRWEWRPGSTLFLVWQQEREIEDRLGNLRLRRDLRQLGLARPANVFMFKISYWLNP